MAFYSSSYAGSGFGEYNYNSYAVNYDYDYAQNPCIMAYNYQEFDQPYYGYNPSLYYNDPAPSYPTTISYSAATFNEPKFIEYDPKYERSELVIYHSNLEFNETEFEEYDPTPYGGGYDIVETYGKPLPPSDQTCYPRSGPVVPLPAVERGTQEKAIVPQNHRSAGQVTDEMPQPQVSLTDLPKKEQDKIHDTHQDLNSSAGEDIKEHEEEYEDDDSGPGNGSGYGNGYSGGQYDEYERPVPEHYPYGYGLEALDLCESVFGYWPCLARMKKKQRENCCEGVDSDDIEGDYCCNRENMWKGTADYLFGSPNPYGGGGGGGSYGGGFVYAYPQRHYATQAQYRHVQNDGNSSWW